MQITLSLYFMPNVNSFNALAVLLVSVLVIASIELAS